MRVKKKEVYTLATLALLTLSLVFTNFSAPIDMSSQVEGAPQQSVLQYLHSEEPIETLHLDLEEAPATITMWGGYYYAYPWSTFWYTETHQYHLTSWNDNGDGGFSPSDQIDMTDDLGDVYWYHVDAITIQMALTRKDMPQPPAIIEYTGPYPMLSPETTIWNEIFPFPGNMYHLSGWMDNGDNALSASDQISMWNMQTGEPSEWHIDQVIVYLDLTQKWSPPGPITNPITTYWHELYPVYCRRYHLSSWRDNGDKKLSASDQIDMENLLTGKIEWYHVDRVTITMFLSPKEVPGLQIAVEYTRSNEEFPWTNPITTLWHEVYPQFSNKYHLSSWTDNEDGILSPSDQIDLTNPKAGQTTWWHVDRITIDIILRRKIANPISLYWRELIPVYYRRKHIIAWRDTGQVEGMLSPGDIITTVDEQGKTDPNLNVDEMTVTLVVTDKQTEATKYLEFEGGFNHMYDALTNPITTYWHEIYPMFSNRYHLYSWEDNGDEIISASDQIVMVDMKTGAFVQYHVDSISYGIKVTRTPVTRHLHSMDTLEPIHMDRVDESIVPIHLDAVAGIIDLTNPKTTYWHELYPNYSNEYHLSSWEDNGDQILSASDQIDMTDELENVYWYHVERVTLTIFLTRKDIPQPPIAIEYMGPYEPRIYQPISTLWHEIFPQYSNVYHIASWEDQGDLYLSPSDQIDMKNLETSELSWWHVDRIATDIILTKKCTPYPKTTYWHELYPNWSNYYHLSSWIDNGDGTLSASDQIDMTNQDTQEITWYHVERVTTTIFLTEKPLGPTEIAMELMYPETLSFTNPTTTEWHEIYPVYCRRYHLTSWEDNGDGILSPSDQIDMTDEGGIVHWYHVDRISKDIILRRKMVDPITTYWHELYPEYSNEYHIHSWEDNGDRELSPSDQIDLLNIHEEITWYHVDDVTITLYVYKKEVGPGIYIEFEGGFNHMYDPITNPLTTAWHEVYPLFSNRYHLNSWTDNGDGILSSSDQIELVDLVSQASAWYHVESISIDITITEKLFPENHDVAVIDILPHGHMVSDIVNRGDNSGRVYVNVTVLNEGTFTETFDVTAYANTTVIGTQPVNNLPPATQLTLKFPWNTVGYALGNYTISAYAQQVIGETHLDDNNKTNGEVIVKRVGDHGGPVGDPPIPTFFAFDKKVDGIDLALFIACYKGPPQCPPNARWLGDLGGPVGDPPIPTFFAYDGKVDGIDLALFIADYKNLGP